MHPKKMVAANSLKFPIKLSPIIFLRFSPSKNKAFAPYSPILFGVIIDAVNDAKHCSKASKKVIFFSIEANVFHFTIFNSQFASVNKSTKISSQPLLKNKIENYTKHLSKITDIEKYHNKLCSNKLLPYQYGKLNTSYINCISLIKLSKNIFNNFDFNILNKFGSFEEEAFNDKSDKQIFVCQ